MSKWKKRLIAAIIIVIFIAANIFAGDKITELLSDPEAVRTWIRSTGIRGILCFAGLNMIQVFLAIVPGGPFTLTAGYVFGPLRGTALCVISCTIASTLVVLMVRRFGRGLVSFFVSEEQLAILNDYGENKEKSRKIERLMMLIFIIPGTPKDPLNYMAGLTEIPVWTWFLVNILGRIPGAYLSALGGSAFGSDKHTALIAAIGGLLLLFVIGRIMKKKIG